MRPHELNCLLQRASVELASPEDAQALGAEVKRLQAALKAALKEAQDMTGDPAIIRTIDATLEGSP